MALLDARSERDLLAWRVCELEERVLELELTVDELERMLFDVRPPTDR